MRRNTLDDLLSRIDRSDDEDACWLWTGFVENTGYGRTSFEGQRIQAHKLFYEQLRGPVPTGLVLRHLCEKRYAPGDITCRRCCNPSHLEPGTPKENMADRDAAGRGALPDNSGERNGRRKISAETARSIREIAQSSGRSDASIAGDFGVSRRLVGLIRQGKIWKNV